MRAMRSMIKLLNDQRAVTSVEYGLIISLICLGIVGAVSAAGSATANSFANVGNEFTAANTR